MSKLVEQVVVKELVEHINNINLNNPRQSAYKTGDSTETALLDIKSGIHPVLVLLDFSAAVDTIEHNTLLDCLKSWFGVCSTALMWFTSYLSHLFQAIIIESTLPELHELMFDVLTGPVLGPLLDTPLL